MPTTFAFTPYFAEKRYKTYFEAVNLHDDHAEIRFKDNTNEKRKMLAAALYMPFKLFARSVGIPLERMEELQLFLNAFMIEDDSAVLYALSSNPTSMDIFEILLEKISRQASVEKIEIFYILPAMVMQLFYKIVKEEQRIQDDNTILNDIVTPTSSSRHSSRQSSRRPSESGSPLPSSTERPNDAVIENFRKHFLDFKTPSMVENTIIAPTTKRGHSAENRTNQMSNNPYGALAEYSDPEDEPEDTATMDKLVAELSPMHKWDQLYDSQGEPHFLPGETIFFEQEPTVDKTVSVDGTVFTIIEDIPPAGDPPTGPTNANVENSTIDGIFTIRAGPASVPEFPLASPLLGNTFRAKRNLPLISGLPAPTPRISNSSMSTGTSGLVPGLAPNLSSPSHRPNDMKQSFNVEFQNKDPHVVAPPIIGPTTTSKQPPPIPPPSYHQAINRPPVVDIRRPPPPPPDPYYRGGGSGFQPPPGPPPGSPPGPPPGPAPPIPVTPVNPPLLRGIDWREHRLDPRNVDVAINPLTNTIHPWYFVRHEVGSSINHGTRFRCFMQPRDQFLSNFDGHINLGSSNASLKSFLLGFPRLPATAEKADIFSFLSAAAYFSSGFGVYIPPPHTLEPGDNKGMWWPLVPVVYKFNLAYYDNALLQVLTSKTTKLADTPLVAHLIHESSGYQILYRLAYYAGHPALIPGRNNIEMPRQKSDMSLIKYRKAWEHYLHVSYLMGVFLSDRYFVECFCERMHDMYSRTLCPHVILLVRRLPINNAVPDFYMPENILEYCGTVGVHVGIRDLDLLSSPRQESDNRRNSRAPSARPLPVQQITQEDELDFLDNEQYLLVCQLSNAPGRSCDLCRSSDHLLRQCPHLMELKNNPMACKRILSALRATLDPLVAESATARPSSPPSRGFVPARARAGPPFRPGTPRTTNRSSDRIVRAVIDTTDGDTDESASITDNESVVELTDDDNTVDERDFPYAGE
jgi:hypothetical protein